MDMFPSRPHPLTPALQINVGTKIAQVSHSYFNVLNFPAYPNLPNLISALIKQRKFTPDITVTVYFLIKELKWFSKCIWVSFARLNTGFSTLRPRFDLGNYMKYLQWTMQMGKFYFEVLLCFIFTIILTMHHLLSVLGTGSVVIEILRQNVHIKLRPTTTKYETYCCKQEKKQCHTSHPC